MTKKKITKGQTTIYKTCSVASLLAGTLYLGNPDRNHKLWNIVSSVCRCCWNVAIEEEEYFIDQFIKDPQGA